MKLGAVYLLPLLIHLTFLSFGTVSLVINLLEHPVFVYTLDFHLISL